MSRPRKLTPSYLPHASGQGRLVWTDSAGVRHFRMLPGPFNSPESLAAKARLELELATSPTTTVTCPAGIPVNEVLLAFIEWAQTYYRTPDGRQTSEVREYRVTVRAVRELYGLTSAGDFGPLALKAVREKFIAAGLCRGVVNQRVDRIKRIFKWAVSMELVPPAVYQGLASVVGLRAGRSAARETEPIKPVDPAAVVGTLPYLNRHLRAMIQLQRFTGMRPGEVCTVKLAELDRTTDPWQYKPARHKTAHHGKGRVVMIGPRGQAVIEEFIAGGCVVDPSAPLFSPFRAREERFIAMRQGRKSKVQPSQQDRRKVNPKRLPAARYTSDSYAHGVADACDKAFPLPPHLGKRAEETAAQWWARQAPEERVQVKTWRQAHRWHPNQLRHLFATEVRRAHGLEAAQTLLGHSRADVTQVYAERNLALAAAVAAKIG